MPGMNPIVVRYERDQFQVDLEKLERGLLRFEEDVEYYCEMIRKNGYEEPVGRAKPASVEEWEKLEKADPNMWAIG